jgi:hypothetical protein
MAVEQTQPLHFLNAAYLDTAWSAAADAAQPIEPTLFAAYDDRVALSPRSRLVMPEVHPC